MTFWRLVHSSRFEVKCQRHFWAGPTRGDAATRTLGMFSACPSDIQSRYDFSGSSCGGKGQGDEDYRELLDWLFAHPALWHAGLVAGAF